jgi:Fe-S oxidoreductase
MGVLSWLKGEKVLYYPGCLTKGVLKTEFENYKEIFNRLGIDFVLLGETEVCCGLPVLNAGYRKDVKKLAEKNLKLFREKGIKEIVTNCPSCLHMFGEVYPKLVREWDIPVEHASVVILKAISRKKVSWKGRDEDREIVAYHDPCYLGRYTGIYEEPREVIRLLGGEILESRENREGALCCGGGGGVRDNFEGLSKDIARERIKLLDSRKAVLIGHDSGEPEGGRRSSSDMTLVGPKAANKIVSPCGLCHVNLKSASDKSVEFSSFVLGKLRGMGR